MTYAVSNIHGCYSQFIKLLSDINFGKDDVMFVLGDVVDIGEETGELLCDLACRENVWPVAGEHDALAAKMLSGFEEMLKNGTAPSEEYIKDMQKWTAMGGKATLDAYRALEADMREGVIDYLADMPAYESVEVNGREWLLVHSGIANYVPGKDLDEYEPEAFFADGGTRRVDGVTVICGHVPTGGRIEHGDGYVAIDCGAARGGALACFCLDNGAEYYV